LGVEGMGRSYRPTAYLGFGRVYFNIAASDAPEPLSPFTECAVGEECRMEVHPATSANLLGPHVAPRWSSALVRLSRLLRRSMLLPPRRSAVRHRRVVRVQALLWPDLWQRKASYLRGLGKAEKIRMRLGGSLGRARCPRAGRVLPKRYVGSHLIIVRCIFARMRRRCSALNTIKWSVHSRRIDPIRRSTCPFCQGDRKDVGLSRIPIARTRANALSLSRTKYFGAVSHGNASVICRANIAAMDLFVGSDPQL
jgi:hypothetical protein